MSSVRIDKLLSNRGYCSRREVQLLVRAGALLEDGIPVKKADQKVNPELVTVDGEEIDPGTGLSLLLYKPVGYVCSHHDRGRLIYELLPERYSRRNPPLSSVGRLDKETSGLLVLTDDGEFNHRLTSPNKKVGKTYHVTVDRPFSGVESERFGSGTLLLDGEDAPLAPAQWNQLSSTEGSLTIFEGRYHQVRRMFESLGMTVVTLHRTHIGSLTLGDLECGSWRMLTKEDCGLLFTPRD